MTSSNDVITACAGIHAYQKRQVARLRKDDLTAEQFDCMQINIYLKINE